MRMQPRDGFIGSVRWRLLVFLVLCVVGAVFSQQPSPLAGQLLPPRVDNNSSAPVYLTISMSKLLNVDTVNYRFEVIMDVITSWDDPRAGSILDAGNLVGLSDLLAANRGVQSCNYNESFLQTLVDSYNNETFSETAADDIDPKCRESLQNPLKDNCSRYCMPDILPTCCDALWIPSINVYEVVSYPQDRYVHDIIIPVSTIGFPNDTAVLRQTRIHATFSSAMSFVKFPFDKHTLSIEFASVGENQHLVASGVTRDRAIILSKGNSGMEQSDEVARWKVTDLSLVCYRTKGLSESSFSFRAMDPKDPLRRVLRQAGTTHVSGDDYEGASACRLRISIQRLHMFYGWNLIFPMVATVSMSFAVFFVDPTDIGVRLSTTTTLFLALTALQFVTNSELPTSSYLTAFNKLTIMSYFVIIFIIFQNLVVHFISSYEDRLHRLKRKAKNPDASITTSCRTCSLIHGASLPGDSHTDTDAVKDPDPDPNPRVHRQDPGDLEAGAVEEDAEAPEPEATAKPRRPPWVFRSVGRTLSKARTMKALVTDGRGYKKAHYLDRACALVVPLVYWVGAILILTS